MISVPWSASHDDDSAGGVSSQDNQKAEAKQTDDMSVYLQHFLSVHNRVHLKRQKRQLSTDTVKTEPAALACIAVANRIGQPIKPAQPATQNLINSKSPLMVSTTNSRLPPTLRPVDSRRSHGFDEQTRSPDQARVLAALARHKLRPEMSAGEPPRITSRGIDEQKLMRHTTQQPLLITESSSAWSSVPAGNSNPPRPRKDGLEGKAKSPANPAGKAAPTVREYAASQLKDVSSSDPDNDARVVNRVDRIDATPEKTTTYGIVAPASVTLRGSLSHNLVDRRRRNVQPTVQMELVVPHRLRRTTKSSSNCETSVGTILERATYHRSANLSVNRRPVMSGSITTATGTPPSNYRFQQVGSVVPATHASQRIISSQPTHRSELLRRVLKEVGPESVLEADDLELLSINGTYTRLGELRRCHLREEDLLRNLYKINSGTFCTVYLGRWFNHDVAVKCPHPKLMASDPLMMTHRAIAEWKILSQITHPHIVKLIGGIVLEEERTIWLVTEYIHSGDIYNFLYHSSVSAIACPPELQGYRRLKLMEQLAEGLSYLHARRVVHKDIKCNNLLITNKDVLKICDFGDAEVLTGVNIQCCTAATWQYVSPELVCSEDPSRPVGATELVDVWAMGCVFLEMLKCPTPFYHLLENVPEGSQRDRLRSLYLQGTLEDHICIPPILPARLRSLLSRCLQFNTSKRNTSHQILSYIRLHKPQLQIEIDHWLARVTAGGGPCLTDMSRPPVLTPYRPDQQVVHIINPLAAPSESPRPHLWPSLRPSRGPPPPLLSPRSSQNLSPNKQPAYHNM